MLIDSWLPIGFKLPDGSNTSVALFEGVNWQIIETDSRGRALIVHDDLVKHWVDAGIIVDGQFDTFSYGDKQLRSITSGKSQAICPVAEAESPDSKAEALSFALALNATRLLDTESPLQDSIYVEKISRLLPTYSISSRLDDDIILGYWLTGGAPISVKSFRRLSQTISWMGGNHLRDVVKVAGFDVSEVVLEKKRRNSSHESDEATAEQFTATSTKISKSTVNAKNFELPGRYDLASFFNEHVVDIVQNSERYKVLGIEFPSAVVLHGPPGCGKTFAVERLVEFLGWPSFQIDASSIASPYIHETSKKVAEMFDKAIENAPSVLVIDEMEAFLANRELGSGHHRVEEVAEFLRRIPEAVNNNVLIIAMTNRIDMIDPAILRRGRFDHVIKVDYASEAEILSLLEKLLSTLPKDESVDPRPFAAEMAGRPLSDVAFVLREGARLAARAGKVRLDQGSLSAAMETSPSRQKVIPAQHKIGFI